jgi:hypothetical protein
MDMPDFEPEWYIRNNKLMAPRYAKEFKKIGVNWNTFYREMRELMEENEYYIWIFLCGIPETLKEVKKREIKNPTNFIVKYSRDRILYRIKDKNISFYLNNL